MISPCNNEPELTPEHEHEVFYYSDDNNHAKNYKCGCSMEDEGRLEAHCDNDSDGLCDVCGHKIDNTYDVKFKLGTYQIVYNDDSHYNPNITFYKDGTFNFSTSVISSQIVVGTYEIIDKKLELKPHNSDEIVTFKIYRYTIIYESGKLPSAYFSVGEELLYDFSFEQLYEMIALKVMEEYDMAVMPKIDKYYDVFFTNGMPIIPYLLDGVADSGFWSEEVGGVTFHYRDGRSINIYYKDKIYSLNEAFSLNILTKKQLIKIATIQNENCKLGHSYDEGKTVKNSVDEEEILYICNVCGGSCVEGADISVDSFNQYCIETNHNDFYSPFEIIHSKDELIRYYEENKYYCEFNFNIGYKLNFTQVCDLYTKDFFQENSLILFTSSGASTADSTLITSYQIKDDELIIHTKNVNHGLGGAVVVGYHMFLEVSKEHLNNVSNVTIYKDGKITNPLVETRKLSEFYPFLNSIPYWEFGEVQYVNYFATVAPGTILDIKSTQDVNDINAIFSYFNSVKLELTDEPKSELLTGAGYPFYRFITKDGVEFIIYLSPDYYYNNFLYKAKFDVFDMEKGVEASCILTYADTFDVYYQMKDEPFILTQIDYLEQLALVEYDNEKNHYLSDRLYIDFDGIKLRIIDETHLEFNGKYFEIVGSKNLKEIIEQTDALSAEIGNSIITIKYPMNENYIFRITLMNGSVLNHALIQLIMSEYPQMGVSYYYYIDKDCFIPLTETNVSKDMTIYVSTKSYECE